MAKDVGMMITLLDEDQAFVQWCDKPEDLLVEAANAVNAASTMASVEDARVPQNLDDAADDYWWATAGVDDE